MVYKWAAGSQIKIDAQQAGERIELLKKNFDGKLRPKNLVDDARHVRSPLHKAFEWDDGVAAEQYREQQASYILRSIITVHVSISEPKSPPQHMRAFVNVRTPGNLKERTFRPMADVLSDEDLRTQLLETARNDFYTWRDRYKKLVELTELFEAGDLVFGRIPRRVKHNKKNAA